MKKILLLLLIFISYLPASAQLQKSTVLDFTNPRSLNPSVDPAELNYTNAIANVANKTFISDDISISFSGGSGSGGFGAYIKNYLYNAENNTSSFGLEINSNTEVHFTALNGATLNSIEFDKMSSRGGLSLKKGEAGSFPSLTWTADASNVYSVTFENYSTRSKLLVVTITYTAPQNVLTPSASIYDGEILTSFRYITLTFPSSVSAVSTSGITISGTQLQTTMQTSISGRTVTLSLPNSQVINTDGDFIITVPEGCFRDAEGYCNAALTYRFSVREPRNTFNLVSVEPANGTVLEQLDFPITLTFPNDETNYIGYVNSSSVIYLRLQGSAAPIAQLHPVLADNGQVELQITGSVKTFKNDGVYTLSIPEKTVYNQMYGTDYARYNNAINLSYTVVAPVDPLKDLKDEAARLYSQIGKDIGYPAAGSDAASMLANVTAADANPTKEELEEAIAAFYSETNIVMPTEGLWYNIIGVNANGKTLYLSYANGKVGVVSSLSNAAAFKLSKDGEDYQFLTADGKYLMSLSSTGVVADSEGKASKLTIEKLQIKGLDSKDIFGMFSIYGWLGRDANDEDLGYSFSTLNYSKNAVAETPVETPYFSTALSSAFKFNTTDDPTYVEPINASVTLSPTSVLLGATSLTLSFDNISSVSLRDSSKPYFSSDAAGKNRVAAAKLTSQSNNTFEVSLTGLAAGTYYLQLPVATFDFSSNDNPVNDFTKSLQFTITEPESVFNTTYTNYVVLQVIERNSKSIDYISDVELNDLVIMALTPSSYSALVPDPSVSILVKNYYSGNVVGRGHFEAYSNFSKDYSKYSKEGYKAIKLVMDEPIKAGDLQYAPDLYGYEMPEAAFGDSKFKDYLAKKAGVKKENCIVNPAGSPAYFLVNNDRATTGIKNVNKTTNNDGQVYDLTGRRVDSPATKGVYIVNGRKVVIK